MYNNDFLKNILEQSEKLEASDIHISEGNLISFRVNGAIKKYEDYDHLTEKQTAGLFETILSKISKKNQEYVKSSLKREGTIGFSMDMEEFGITYRVNAANHKEGYHIVLRRNQSNPPTLDSLGFYNDTLSGLKTIAKKKAGLFLVVGMTGSGKSTTLASIIREINDNDPKGKNIITLEDPIEYKHIPNKSIITQKELGRDINSFELGLKSALREDPDIILVGEIRDFNSLNLAMKAAETGHLVLSTLHTENSISTIQRIIAMSDNADLTRDRLSQVLLGVIAQKLEPTQNGKRVCIWEQLITSRAILNNIKKGEYNQIRSTIDSTPKSQSFNRTLVEHYRADKLRKEDIFKYTTDRDGLEALID